ncbi:HD domain-containing protein [Actinoplanes utahensis]|uniref:Phosphohydrolase n=1 Tax=Actinoplanes utahensis TaxID=1869 RepID=A0A0A6UJZ5_ACTUT|nr:HD domain-containing protein [Actinoplanes utahensis]KHD76435.1 phosphohydrolase [Actinoplanes utahensis]GIF29784.1 phosphohydrolase [Actinoplanes utahensis]
MRIPGDAEIRALHERFAPNADAFELVWTHGEIVCRIAEQIGGGHGLDMNLVRAGCLLHDIGVYRLQPHDPYILHGLLGYQILGEVGLPETLRRFCAHHTGVGITRDDVVRQELPLPHCDFLAESGEEDLVMYADKFHSKSTPPRFLTAGTFALRLARFGDDKVKRFQSLVDRFGEPDLTALATEYGHPVT